jgi:hypothetical protein
MRLMLAAAVATAVIGGGLAAVPASAGTLAPVGAITVSPSVQNDGTSVVDVSWASEPSDADGALVCLHRGTNVIATPDSCESQIAVETPRLSSGPIAINPGKNYVVEVFSYQTTSPTTYGTPVSKQGHGVKVGVSGRCGDQTVGSTCRFVGTVTDALTGAKLSNRKLQLWMSKEKQPARWSLVTTKTSSDGVVHAAVSLTKSRLYQWHYNAPHSRELSSSSARVDIPVVS